ncbi:hypothetical protein [Elizabethkingia anophelis]|uniref:Uncharacterized protein n=1 Tax=Elizabethkingia anophelis TaxID=1117645 RepID=A0AAU8UXE1_9FLAO|nr:hypothetical protein [Elizabethkingia anophelis]AQX02543.1 hypothetical protein BBD32_14315 [Elizabethkingia anophelis]EQB93580.1 hypothetical protein C874_02310 [Elizabethkingia anophelis 502]KFC34943.1 hypothetical protein FF18_06215 [Elizabethkingia anophelis]KGT10122.1 hypothetical protein NV63_02360 [Elizabethkingia anophelis]MCL1689270.1 hypothetical protein [Elizabethkingia anophelis]
MIKQNELKESFLKMDYLPPRIEVEFLEIEQGIAAGSAYTIPPNINGKVQDEWENNNDEIHDVEWL